MEDVIEETLVCRDTTDALTQRSAAASSTTATQGAFGSFGSGAWMLEDLTPHTTTLFTHPKP